MNTSTSNIILENMIINTDNLAENDAFAKNIRVFPNPSNGNSINISTEHIACENVVLYNTLGQVIFTEKTFDKTNFTLNLPSISECVYCLEIKTSLGTCRKSVIITKE